MAGVDAFGAGGALRVRGGGAVIDHSGVAVVALDRLAAGNAVDEVGVAAAVEKQDSLVFGFDGRAEKVLEARGDEVDAAAEARDLLHVDKLDVGEGEAADAGRKQEVRGG